MQNVFRQGARIGAMAVAMGVMASPSVFAQTVPATTAALAQVHPAMRQVLQYGSRNHWVATLQADLKLLGYTGVGPTDGIFGPRTLNALQAFESANGFTVNGKTSAPVWQDVLAGLNLVPSVGTTTSTTILNRQIAKHPAMSQWLRKGSRGHWVMTLQANLRLLGYKSVGPVDGIFGPLTQAALEQFQKTHNLAVNGIATPATWQLILSGLGVLDNKAPASTAQPTVTTTTTAPASQPTGTTSTTPPTSQPTVTTTTSPAPSTTVTTSSGGTQMIDGYPVIAVYHVRATAYGPSLKDNYPFGPVDAFGQPLEPGMIAVDPSLIPLKSRVYVKGYTDSNLPTGGFLGRAMDTGGAIKGHRIDIFMNANPQTVSNFGIEPVTVYVLGN